jgi:hypothetical protein
MDLAVLDVDELFCLEVAEGKSGIFALAMGAAHDIFVNFPPGADHAIYINCF